MTQPQQDDALLSEASEAELQRGPGHTADVRIQRYEGVSSEASLGVARVLGYLAVSASSARSAVTGEGVVMLLTAAPLLTW